MKTDKPETSNISTNTTDEPKPKDNKVKFHLDIHKRPIISPADLPEVSNDDTNKPRGDFNVHSANVVPIEPTKPIHPQTKPNDDNKSESVYSTAYNTNSISSDKESLDNVDENINPAKKDIELSKEDINKELKIQEDIRNRKFYIPVDSSSQKKSIKASAGLTVLVIFLGLILIDLMLDSGVILFVQKLPHTHFFSTSQVN